jgi:hypothetical protein
MLGRWSKCVKRTGYDQPLVKVCQASARQGTDVTQHAADRTKFLGAGLNETLWNGAIVSIVSGWPRTVVGMPYCQTADGDCIMLLPAYVTTAGAPDS